MKSANRTLSLLLAACLLLSCAACGGEDQQATATSIRLVQTEGDVDVADEDGGRVKIRDGLGLFSGYQVDTGRKSYAWIDLDEYKLTKMDEDSGIEIQKNGKKLEVVVSSGALFFHVTSPLEDDEELNIRTSTMAVGIRGTCGWVYVQDRRHMEVYILEGTVECTVKEETATVDAGEMAVLTRPAGEDPSIEVRTFTEEEVPAFVLEETDEEMLAGLAPAEPSEPVKPVIDDVPTDTPSLPTLADRLEGLRKNSVSYERLLINRFDGILERFDPPEALGFINGLLLDVNGDGEDELVMVTADSSRRIDIEILDAEGLQYCRISSSLGYDSDEFGSGGSRIDVFLYYSETQDAWYAAVCGVLEGTDLQQLDAALYRISPGVVGPERIWYWDDITYDQLRLDGIRGQMEELDWPYMGAGFLSFWNVSSMDSCVWLARMEVEMERIGNVAERYLHILSPEDVARLP